MGLNTMIKFGRSVSYFKKCAMLIRATLSMISVLTFHFAKILGQKEKSQRLMRPTKIYPLT